MTSIAPSPERKESESNWEYFARICKERTRTVVLVYAETGYKPGGLTPVARAAALVTEDETVLDGEIWRLAHLARSSRELMQAVVQLATEITASTCQLYRWLVDKSQAGLTLLELLAEVVKAREEYFIRLEALSANLMK